MSYRASLTIAIAGGTGPVGRALGKVLARAGHHIVILSREPEGPKAAESKADIAAAAKGGAASVGIAHEHDLCAADTPKAQLSSHAVVADAVILAYASPQNHHDIELFTEIFGEAGKLKGVPVIDATNPLGRHMTLRAIEGFHSAAEAFAAHLPGAIVYKAFNTIGAQHFGKELASKPTMLYCGGSNPADAPGESGTPKARSSADGVVARIISDAGFTPQWVGPLRLAHNLEAMAELWVAMSYVTKAPSCADGNFAFTVQHF